MARSLFVKTKSILLIRLFMAACFFLSYIVFRISAHIYNPDMPLTDYTWEPPVIYAIITAAIGMASWPAYYFYKLWKVRNDKKAEQDKLKGV